MLLATSFISEFSRFIQIISWIILPIAVIAVSATIYSHYRKKNKSVAIPTTDEDQTMTLIAQGNTGQKINGADYIYFDHFALINEYEKRLASGHARFSALKKDFVRLENMLQETKQQNELLTAALADEKKLTALLQEKLNSEQSKMEYLERKLTSNKQVLKRLYKELTSVVDTDINESPVIELKPVYADTEESKWHESMAQ